MKYGAVSRDFICLRRKKQVIIAAFVYIVTLAFNLLIFVQPDDAFYIANISIVYTILATLAGIDIRRKIIPNSILAVGIVLRIALMVCGILLYPDSIKVTLIDSAAGFGFGLLFLLVLSFITKHGIGYGDVKLFAWLGLCIGLFNTYYVLFYSVLVAAVIGVYMLLVKKAERKEMLPFAPFVYAGFVIVICMALLS